MGFGRRGEVSAWCHALAGLSWQQPSTTAEPLRTGVCKWCLLVSRGKLLQLESAPSPATTLTRR